MSDEDAMWDPNTWTVDDMHEYRIYGDDRLTLFAVVDAIDYQWAIRWRWNPVKMHGGKRREKIYLRRSVNIKDENGAWIANGTVLLHVEIMRRKRPQPSPLHYFVDHGDGNSLNCRRYNLDWVTPSMNARNRKRS